ncbi:MAG: hypothetical protein STSR0008_06470 [Ignavibacterium sp.]
MKKSFLIFVLLLLISSCYQQDKMDYNFEPYVKNHEIYSWINLMPGIDIQPTLYLTGNFSFKNLDQKSDIKLSKIEIFQNGKLILEPQPIVENTSDNISNIKFKIQGIKNFKSSELNVDDAISLKLWIKMNGNFYYYSIPNILIEKVY